MDPAARGLAAKALEQAQNPNPGIYNLRDKQLRNWRKARSSVRLGLSRPVIACVGHSIVRGYNTNNAGWTAALTYSFPTRLAMALETLGVPANANSFIGTSNQTGANIAAQDSRLTLGAGWDGHQQSETFGGALLVNTTSTTNKISWSAGNVDTFELFAPVNANLGTLTVDADGTVLGTSVGNGSVALPKRTFTTALGPHVLGIAATTLNVGGYIAGWNCYNSAVPAVDILNGGIGGSKAGDWLGATYPWSPLNALAQGYHPSLTIVFLDINDWENAVPVATFAANLQTFLSSIPATSDIVLMSAHETGGTASAAAQQPYRGAIRSLASSNNCVLVEWANLLGSYAEANASGLMADTLHPNKYVADAYAMFLAELLSR